MDNRKKLRQHFASSIASKYRSRAFQGEVKTSQYNIPVQLNNGNVLLFNSYTRALTKLSQEEFFQLNRYDSAFIDTDDNKQYFGRLLSNGFLVPASSDELSIVERDFNASRQSIADLGLTIAPTMGCNLACGYCFQGQNKPSNKFDARVIEAIVSHVSSQKTFLNSLTITWYGGEPLMAKPAIFKLSDQLIELCNNNGISYSASIVTNGYLLDVKTAESLLKRGCSSAQITIDGLESTHDKMRPKLNGRGSFKKTIENIKAVLENTHMQINVRVNIGRDNIHECHELLNYLEHEGIAQSGRFSLYFAPIDASTAESGSAFEEGMSKQEFNKQILRHTRTGQEKGLIAQTRAPSFFLGMCVAAKNNGLVVAPNGDLHKCWETMHDSAKKIGTIFDISEVDASRNNKLWDYWSPFDNETCRACKVLPLCGGMCGHRFVYSGEGNEESTPCPDWKWNTAENIFARARDAGVVVDEEWADTECTIDTKVSGERHSQDSLLLARQSLELKLVSMGVEISDVIYMEAAQSL